MLDHTGIVVTDLQKARAFYDAVAKALGLGIVQPHKEFFLLGQGPGKIPYLWIGTLKPSYWIEGSRAGINQMHVAFTAKDESAVDEFHRAALAAGGRDNGKPGPRQGGDKYYGAFVLDPDGNNIEAVARG
ncbi:MAG TPA: VOC family protein [Steroidobacteraceae bacterium]|nr:VOC family protein [Steroidobacteraceae bacterium]